MYSKEIQQRSWFVACIYFFLCHFPHNSNINGVTFLGKRFPISYKARVGYISTTSIPWWRSRRFTRLFLVICSFLFCLAKARCINFVADISELHYELHCRIHKRAGENQILQLVFNFRKYPLQQRMHAAFQLLYGKEKVRELARIFLNVALNFWVFVFENNFDLSPPCFTTTS